MASRAGASAGVAGLVGSIKQHKNFKQLAGYSVQCLVKAITPPALNWERSLREAYEAGALEAITAVLSKHAGDEEVTAAATAALAAIAADGAFAAAVVETGAMMGVLESLVKNPAQKSGVKETLALFEKVATTAPGALLAVGGADAAARLAELSPKGSPIAPACLRVMDHLAKMPEGLPALLESDSMGAVMRVFASSSDQDTLETCLRLLDRFARQPDAAEKIRGEHNGLQVLCTVLAAQAEDSKVAKLGGRVLAKLASTSVSDVVAKMQGAAKPEEREFMANLLANLSLNEEYSELILENGGLRALVQVLGAAPSQKTTEAAARALSRLVADASQAREVVDAGVVPTLAGALEAANVTGAAAASITSALARIGSRGEGSGAAVAGQGGLAAVLRRLAAHPGEEAHSLFALALLEELLTSGEELPPEVEAAALGALPAVCAAVKAHPAHVGIQLNGTRVLTYVSGARAAVGRMVAAGAPALVLLNLAVPITGAEELTLSPEERKAAVKKDPPAPLLAASMFLMTQFALTEEGKAAIGTAGGDTIMAAVSHFTRTAGDQGGESSVGSIAAVAEELMLTVVSEAQVISSLNALVALTDSTAETRSKVEAAKLRALTTQISAFAATPVFAEAILATGGIGALLHTVEVVSAASGLPGGERVLVGAAGALQGILRGTEGREGGGEAAVAALAAEGGGRILSGAVKAAPKMLRFCSEAMSLLAYMSQNEEIGDAIAQTEGGVEACAAVLRANPTNAPAVANDAVATLLALGASDKGALAVAKGGGSRQVIATLAGNMGDEAFATSGVLERSIGLLHRVSLTSEGAELLVRQGGVDAMIDAASELGKYSPEGAAQAEEVLASLVSVLGRLLSPGQVRAAAEAVKALAASAATAGAQALTVEALRTALIKLPIMAGVPDFATILSKAGVPAALLALNDRLLRGGAADAGAATVGAELSFKCMASLLKNGGKALAETGAMAEQAVATLRAGVAPAASLEFLKAACRASPAEALKLAGDGATLPLVVATLQARIGDKEVSSAGFRMLGALGGHDATAPLLAESPALPMAAAWLEENAEDASEESVAAALSALGTLGKAPAGTGPAALRQGLCDAVRGVLQKRCDEDEGGAPEGASPAIMGAACGVLATVARMEAEIAARLAASGVLRRAVRSLAGNKRYMSDEGCALEACRFIGAAAALGGEAGAELAQGGAMAAVLTAMSANFTSEAVLAAGASALEALGVGEEAATAALEEVRELNARLSEGPDERAEGALGGALQRLSNLAVIRGVVGAANASELLDAVATSLELLTVSPTATSAGLATALQAMGRVVDLGGAAVDAIAPRAVDAVVAAMACRRGANVGVRTAGVHTLGQMVASRGAAEALMRIGGIKVVSDTAKKHHADARLQSVAHLAAKRITAAATRFATGSLNTPEGLITLAALLNAHAGEPETLAEVLANVVGSPGGAEAVLAVIAAGMVSNDVLGAALEAVAAEGGERPAPSEKGRVAALIAAINAALAMQATLTSKSDERAKRRALTVAASTLTLLKRTAWDPLGAEAFITGGGGDALMAVLAANKDDPETVASVMKIMRALIASGAPASALKALLPHMKHFTEVVRDFARADPAAAADALDCITALTRGLPEEARSAWEKEVLRAASLLSRANPGSSRILAAIRALEAAWGKKIADTDAAERAFGVNVAALLAKLRAGGGWQEVLNPDGRSYFFDPATNTTVWECPPAFLKAKEALRAAADCAVVMGEDADVGEVDRDTIATLIAAVKDQVRAPEPLLAAVEVLTGLSINVKNAINIVDLGGILALIAAANAHPNNLTLLRMVLLLVERVSILEAWREAVASQGGCDLLIAVAVGIHHEVQDVVLRALTALSNLAVGTPPNVELIMAKNGVKAVEKALQVYKDEPRVLEQAMAVLSNLMYGNEQNKLVIGQTCGDEVTGVIMDHVQDGALVKQALRALGNLTFCWENVRFIVEEHHATKAIVGAMRAHTLDDELTQDAMAVLSNCAAVEEPEPERDENGDPIGLPPDSVCSIILREAGCSQVIATLKRGRNNPAMVIAALQCLATIAIGDAEVSEKMCLRQGLLQELLELASMYNLDEEVLTEVCKTLQPLTFARGVHGVAHSLGLLPAMLAIMQEHTDCHDLLAAAGGTLTNLAAMEEGREVFRALNAVPEIMALLEGCREASAFCREAMITLTRLCTEADLAALVATSGMHIIMATIGHYEIESKFLSVAFKLLGHLAFEPANLKAIVQHNGIQKIIRAITMHPDYRPLMVSAIQTLDNIAMGSTENATIVIEEGGKELIQVIMESHADSPEIQRYGKSALLSMSALEGLARSAQITAKAARSKALGGGGGGGVGEEAREDPLGLEFRQLLAAGRVFKVWQKGTSSTAHVVMSPDFRSILWQEPNSSQKKLGALELRAVVGVKAGVGAGHKKSLLSMQTAAKHELSFSVLGEHNNLDLEAQSQKEQAKWVEAFTRLLHVYKTAPGRLVA